MAIAAGSRALITLLQKPDGTYSVIGPIDDRAVCDKLLMLAHDLIYAHHLEKNTTGIEKKSEGPEIALPTAQEAKDILASVPTKPRRAILDADGRKPE